MNRKHEPLTGVWLYGGNVHIAYRHIAKHQNVMGKAMRHQNVNRPTREPP